MCLLGNLEEMAMICLQDEKAWESADGFWEAQCILLLWLSQLVLVPFDLSLLDSSLQEAHMGER